MTRNGKIKLGAALGGAFVLGAIVAVIATRKNETSTGLGADVKQLPPTTRSSCIECVDKHLGAAMVLLGETRDGYPHRLRAIGHLHEAEDESQAWPALHDAIRVMRKDFQQTGQAPDFELLEQLSRNIRGV